MPKLLQLFFFCKLHNNNNQIVFKTYLGVQTLMLT